MNSQTWTAREKAFREMPNLADLAKQDPSETDRLRLGLIRLLTVENETVRNAKRTGLRFTTEEHSDYYGDLIGAVADLNDKRAIPALLGAITSGGMATRGLARFGEQALTPVLNRLSDPDPLVRASVLWTVRHMLRMGTASDLSCHARIEAALRSSLRDPDFVVRSAAISAVEYLDDRQEFVPTLRELAEHDPERIPGKSDDGGEHYPVRLEAKRLLEKIANHESPQIDKGLR